MYEFAGPAALVVVGLWIAYLVPHKLRHRQQLLESRTDDRFSDALRVLAVTGPEGSDRRRRAEVAGGVRQDCGPVDKRVGLLTPGAGNRLARTERGGVVYRPHGTQDRIGADAARRAAQLHAAHAAASARRGAAARRRGMLAGVLLVAAVAGWVVVGVTALGVLAGVVPTVLLAGVLALGRRAAVQGRAAEEEWERRIAEATAPLRERAARPGRKGAEGRAVRPSLTETQAIQRVRADAPVRTSTRVRDGGREGDTWSPVAVPRPTYAMKAPAPRREPAPLGEVEGSTHAAPAARRTTAVPEEATATAAEAPAAAGSVAAPAAEGSAAAEAPATPAASSTPGTTAPATEEPTGSIDLNAVLARRRAAGE
ncbi:hypothetical protein [Cellulomonas pakistanensis]|uniref:Uncharacterized protein n=1 Tax=Cellulomonas pakistanensis TaxID=992287 RepID=A0A919U2X4_9CELL|nr:hypothetical protein [Cellulomonas pakistanensis]GIG36548.1 hypothetical protein Cpa01nite_19290 [Cellulomonas pakistanensis]